MVDFEGIRQKKKMENWRNMVISKTSPKRFCNDLDLDYETVMKKIKDDEWFRWFFVVDPIRQNVHELTAMNYIRKIPGVKEFKKFRTNEMYVINGGVVKKEDLNDMVPSCKSIDFFWKFKNRDIYAYHKYAKEGGGHQDNQYVDAQAFLRECNHSASRKRIFILMADGKGFKKQNGKVNVTKLERLKDLANKRNTFAMTIEDLEGFLGRL